jgi:hypothetical protein
VVNPAINPLCQPTPSFDDLNSGAVPANALLDEFGAPVLDEFGNYILTS